MAVKSVTFFLNGQQYELEYDNTTGTYKKTIAAPAETSWNEPDNKYAMQLKVEDVAGNVTTIDKTHSTFGAEMMLRVKEKTRPVINLTSPADGAYLGSNSVRVEFTVTDNGSGVNPNSIRIQLDAAAAEVGKTIIPIQDGYKCTHDITCGDGEHRIKINAKDHDENAATEQIATFTIDTVPPELNVTSPAASLITNKQKCIVSGTTNTKNIDILVNNIDQGVVTVDASGKFTHEVTLYKGSNVIKVRATDAAQKVTTVTREVTYDPVAPVIVSIDIAPNPVDTGAQFTVTVEATDE